MPPMKSTSYGDNVVSKTGVGQCMERSLSTTSTSRIADAGPGPLEVRASLRLPYPTT